MVEHVCVVCNVWVFCDVHDFFFQYRVLSTVSHIFISTFLQPFILISFFSSFLVWIYDKWRWTIRLSIFFFLLPLLDLYCLSYICVGQLFIYIYEFWIMNFGLENQKLLFWTLQLHSGAYMIFFMPATDMHVHIHWSLGKKDSLYLCLIFSK